MPASPPLPLAPEPALQTAARLLAEGRPDQAAERLAALLAEAPTYAAAHVLHATALEAAGRAADALAAWSQAAFLVPRSPLVQRERQRLAALFAAPEPAEPPPAGVDSDPDTPDRSLGGADRPLSDPDQPLDLSDLRLGAVDRNLGAVDRDPGLADRHLDLPDRHLGDANRHLIPSDRDLGDADRSVDGVDESLDEPDTPRVFDEPFLEGLPLESLTTLFETDTPLFVEDDEEEPAAQVENPVEAPPVADWGDLPPVGAPLLPPDAPAPGAPATPSETTASPEPDDWRVIETVDAGDDVPPPFTPPVAGPAEPSVAEPSVPTFEPFSPAPDARPTDDLDALISSLEQAPRIRPDPAFSGPAVRVDESGVDEMVSETLAQIYAAQHRYTEAAVMYEKLAAREPARADTMLRRAAELRERR